MRFIFGFIAFAFLVIQPLRANLIAALASQIAIDNGAKATLLEYAAMIDPCSPTILDTLGDTWGKSRQYHLSAIAYGRAIQCSPGSATARFKYGAAVVLMGFPKETRSMEDAIKLEPGNPLFRMHYQRVKALQ